jgi:hypothetical protein
MLRCTRLMIQFVPGRSIDRLVEMVGLKICRTCLIRPTMLCHFMQFLPTGSFQFDVVSTIAALLRHRALVIG